MLYHIRDLAVRGLFLILFLTLSLGVFYAWWTKESPEGEYRLDTVGAVFFGDEPITIAVADTISRRAKGLSDLPSLPDGHGLWFDFSGDGLHGIWMKDMLFPIDIIWIDSEYRVVSIARKIYPDTFPQTFFPTVSARFVLEINSGEANKLGIVNGQIVRLEIPIGQAL
jgi:uncharacterized protein